MGIDPEIHRVDRSSRSLDDGVKSSRLASEKSSRSYVFEVEPVDFQHL